jgi:hypothetical protein
MSTVDQDNEIARAKKLAQLRDQTRIFVEVFGTRDKPTPHGKFILETLRSKLQGSGALPKNVVGNDGHTDMGLTFRQLGHYDAIEAIYNILDWRESSEQPRSV